jgi:hypothetical protein
VRSRAFARDQEQRIGTTRSKLQHHLEQESDVLFVCGAADEQQQRPLLLEPVTAAKCASISRLEALGRKPRGQYFDAAADAVGQQGLLHGLRGRDDGVQLIALRTAEPARQAAGNFPR